MPKKIVPINYTSRDFSSIKKDLVSYAKRYYPNSFQDFNEASFGSLMLDTVAYVGDILSFYVDYQANESFLSTAIEYENVVKHGYETGYNIEVNPSSYGELTFFVEIPAMASGTGPDRNYMPILKRGSSFTSGGGSRFLLTEDVNFSDVSNEIIVLSVSETTGLPVSYAAKAKGKIMSGKLVTTFVSIGEFERFMKIPIVHRNIAEIVSIHDSKGHEYYQVDYLSQDVVYRPVRNRNSDRYKAPFLIKPFTVPRRFTVERRKDRAIIQFGYGSDSNLTTEKISAPEKVVLKTHGKSYITDESFDPSNLIATDKFGVAPSNTTLEIVMRLNTMDNVNAAAHSVNQQADAKFEFINKVNLSSTNINSVIGSLELTNEEPILGDITLPSADQVKERIKGSFYTQNRAVTKQDYINLTYKMPSIYGSIKRCNIIRDPESAKRNLNLYVISEGSNGLLAETNDTIKENLRVWLNKNRMINDTVDILDAKVVNLGIEYKILGDLQTNRFELLDNATEALRQYFRDYHFDIGEPLVITDLYKVLRDVNGVIDVMDLELVPKTGGVYSDVYYDIDNNISPDGRVLFVPRNVILEFKYPVLDVKGSIV